MTPTKRKRTVTVLSARPRARRQTNLASTQYEDPVPPAPRPACSAEPPEPQFTQFKIGGPAAPEVHGQTGWKDGEKFIFEKRSSAGIWYPLKQYQAMRVLGIHYGRKPRVFIPSIGNRWFQPPPERNFNSRRIF